MQCLWDYHKFGNDFDSSIVDHNSDIIQRKVDEVLFNFKLVSSLSDWELKTRLVSNSPPLPPIEL